MHYSHKSSIYFRSWAMAMTHRSSDVVFPFRQSNQIKWFNSNQSSQFCYCNGKDCVWLLLIVYSSVLKRKVREILSQMHTKYDAFQTFHMKHFVLFMNISFSMKKTVPMYFSKASRIDASKIKIKQNNYATPDNHLINGSKGWYRSIVHCCIFFVDFFLFNRKQFLFQNS